MKNILTVLLVSIFTYSFSQIDSLIIYKLNNNTQKIINLGNKLLSKNTKMPESAYMIISSAYIDNKQANKALDIISKAIYKYPESINLKLYKAKIFYTEQQLLKAYNSVSKIKSNNRNVLLLKYKIFNSLKKYDEALTVAEILYKSNKKNIRYIYMMANSYNKLNKINKAVYYYDLCIKTDSSFSNAYYKLAQIYSNSNKEKSLIKAGKYIDKADSLSPNKKNYIKLKAKIYYIQKNYLNAANEYKRLLEFDENNKVFNFRLAASLMQQEQYNRAYKYAKKAYNLDSTNYKFAQYYGVVSFHVGRRFQAKYLLEKAIKLTQPDKKVMTMLYRQLANLNFAMQNYSESAKYRLLINKIQPDDIENIYYLAESYYKLKDYRKAEKYYDLIGTSMGEDVYNHILERKKIIKEKLFFETGK